MYSCGYFESAADSLEQAQAQKVDRICRALRLSPTDHVLEIGSGWGGFAVWAATRYGCRVTTTTISDEQYRHVCEWRSRIGEAGARIEVLRADYRELTGRFDKVVSIEMFEAVGLSHYDDYFTAVDRLLAPDGVMFLQTITVDDQWFPQYHGTPDWIEKYIFPGGELASVGEMLKSLARTTSLSLYHAENCGTHYAHTLRAWRARFHQNLARVRALGFDDRFIRMWDLYLASCEATFLERHTGLFQLVLVKNGAQRVLFNEPWSEPASSRTPRRQRIGGLNVEVMERQDLQLDSRSKGLSRRMTHERIRLGISACLLGEPVRFDGGHKRDPFLVESLGPFVDWVPVCPEVESGLDAPRESMRLVQADGRIRLLTNKTAQDHTTRMHGYARRRVEELADGELCGFVLKKDSPTCGLERVKVYGTAGMPVKSGRGLFADALVRRFPLLPVEEEGRLNDPRLRENFVERIFAYRRLTALFAGTVVDG